MAPVLSKPELRSHAIPLVISATSLLLWYRRRNRFLKQLNRSESQRSFADLELARKVELGRSRNKTNVSIGMLIPILRLALGRRELANLLALTLALLMRTFMTLWIANSFGTSMKHLCEKKWRKLFSGTRQFASWSFLAAVTNGFLKYGQHLLAANVRERLTAKAHELYMSRMNFYKANKVGPDKLENADQLITDDINKFSEEMADCYSNTVKPAVDLMMFTWDLHRSMGLQGPVGMYGWFAVSAYISTVVLPPYGRLFAEEQVLEGRFRTGHAELIQNGEMVAFFGGERPEKAVLDKGFKQIRRHVLSVLEMKLPADVIQGYVNKYLASVVGFFLVVRPIYMNHEGKGSMTAPEIAKYFVMRRQILEGLATSVLAFFELSKKIGNLKGLAARLNLLFKGLQKRQPILEAQMAEHASTNPPRFVAGDSLKFERVSVHRPDGVLLIKALDMEVKPGDRVMITGDNGCGKSSLFRVLCGLWPLVGGTITKPSKKDIYFLSQVNFVPIGTFRELVIYPQTVSDMHRTGKSDADVMQALDWAHLKDLSCDGVCPGLNDTLPWGTALSPGQKQRMAFARLLYHRPKYAILDECTNGISPDVERDLYNRCRKLGMAVFSISHKVELKKLHDRELHIHADGYGGYSLLPIQ